MVLKSKKFFSAFIVILAALFSSPAFGQWTTQTITLRPGWNAVFLEVQPEPDDSTTVFQGMPIESVWMWNHRFSSVQFIQDVNTLVPEQPEWLHYFPPESGKDFLTNLFIIQGARGYLIKLKGSQSVNWEVKGKPVVRVIDWMADSFNLVGFHVDAGSALTFNTFFAASTAHLGQPIYQLNASGQWEKISDPANKIIQPGEAYWVYCEGQSTYSGPLRVTLEQGGAIDFGRTLSEQILRVKNETSAAKQITLTHKPSEPPPPTEPSLAGQVLLTYWDWGALASGWIDFPAQLQRSIQPGQELALRLGVKRKDMQGSTGSIYQSLLDISDGQGLRLRFQVSAMGLTSYQSGGGTSTLSTSSNPWAGLWVGSASIRKVSQPGDDADPLTPQPPLSEVKKPPASEVRMRLIVHADSSGLANLLQRATLMWKDGTRDQNGEVIVPGRYVIVTTDDPSVVSRFSGAALIDGIPVVRRVSSVFFSHKKPIPSAGGQFPMTGAPGLSFNIALEPDDPLNPFRHVYHPDHDARDDSFRVVRKIQLEFTETDPEGLTLAGWGDSCVGGVYRETLKGLYSRSIPSIGTTIDEIHVEGVFRLHRASTVAVLNDGIQVP